MFVRPSDSEAPSLLYFAEDMDLRSPHASGATTNLPSSRTHARQESATSRSPQGEASGSKRKRSSANGDGEHSPISDQTAAANPRRGHKVTRACDHCKYRKAKCTGTQPCPRCTEKGVQCVYDAKYSRGHPRPPRPADIERDVTFQGSQRAESHEYSQEFPQGPNNVAEATEGTNTTAPSRPSDSNGPASRASPALGVAEIEGQVFDPTSGLTFLHRAWKRLAKVGQSGTSPAQVAQPTADGQQVMFAGDKPLPTTTEADVYGLTLPSYQDLVHLIALYFDVYIATYRILHRPSVESWLQTMDNNVRYGEPAWHDLGKPKTAILLACLSVATSNYEKSQGIYSTEDDALSLARSDQLFCVSLQLTETESGSPSLYSAQARIIQTLYLLTTCRMNRAWYTFGNALQLISALGLHRRMRQQRSAVAATDYMQTQLRIRTFWTAYILDKYLGVIFGRPRHYHDEDIDQDLPDRLEDNVITPQGPTSSEGNDLGCHIDGLIFHARIAKIIGKISREVYSIRPISESERIVAAHRLSGEIQEWKDSLPAYLGSIHPSMLVASFRRQSIVIKIAHCHAIMHANRLFLLATLRPESKAQIHACIGAAKSVLDIVDGLAREGPIFHASWWTHYVTFCALVVSYTWDVQLRRRSAVLSPEEETKHLKLMEVAKKCQTHLAKATARNSPSRRYAVILEEFCSAAMGQKRSDAAGESDSAQRRTVPSEFEGEAILEPSYIASAEGMVGGDIGCSLLDEWNPTDWLDLDSSAFGPYVDVDNSSTWMPNMDLSAHIQ